MLAGKQKRIKVVFYTLVSIFILLIIYFTVPTLADMKQTIFPLAAILALAFFVLGAVLIILTKRAKIKGKLKKYLILTGASSVGFLTSVLLHNLFYGLNIIAANITILRYLMEGLHIAFFLIGIFACPIGFLVGAIGSIMIFIKKKDKT